MQSLTLVMEDTLFQAANTYATERGLTLTQLLKTYLTHLTQVSTTTSDPLEQFSIWSKSLTPKWVVSPGWNVK